MSQTAYIFRWDDVSPHQDKRKFQLLVDLFMKYGVPAVLGVVPRNADKEITFDGMPEPEFVDQLRALAKCGWEIAQHGYQHLKHTESEGILGLNPASEFAGREYADQLADIEAGRRILQDYGFDPVTFIPPWHSYDKLTLQALAAAGFGVLSDGQFLYPRMEEGLLQLPQVFWSVPRRMSLLELLGAVYTICIHPHLVREEDLRQLERFLVAVKSRAAVASSFVEQSDSLTRKSTKKTLLEQLFVIYNSRQKWS